MNFRRITPFIILMFFIALLFQVGCDTLVTESNTIILFDSSLAVGCFDCHSDDDNMLLRPRGQFDNSAHANHSLLDVVEESCTKCHTHEGFLNTYTDESVNHSAFSVINCFTCHQPHPENPGTYGEWDMKDLRASDTNVRFVETQSTGRNDGSGYGADFGLSNSCGHCHKATNSIAKTNQVILTEDFGPHVSPQADIVSARNGYFFDIASVEPSKLSSHFDNGCIKCHYGKFGEGQGYTFGEHTFRLEDKNSGLPFVDNCNGCHTGNPEKVTDFYDRPSVIEMNNLADSVKSLLASYEVIDLVADTSGLTYEIGKTVSAIKAQAYYNLQMFIKDGSQGIHNPNFVTAMLDSTINVLDSLPAEIDFSADFTEGCNTLDVTFTPDILGAFDSLFWSFGDGAIDTTFDNSPVNHTYNTVGLYSVRLTSISLWNADSSIVVPDTFFNPDDTLIIDSIGQNTSYPSFIASSTSDSLIIDYITIDQPPVASFTYNTDSLICKNDTVIFTSTSDHLLTPTMWGWKVNDSVIISTLSDELMYTFKELGKYTISLSVVTACGLNVVVMDSLITVQDIPTASMSYVTTDSLLFDFTNTSIGETGWSWEFFEDNNSVHTDTTQNPQFTFSAGSLLNTVVITVTNDNQCSHSRLYILPKP